MNPDPYRGLFGANGEMYARDVQEIIRYGTSGHVAAFICEAIQVGFVLKDPQISLVLFFLAFI